MPDNPAEADKTVPEDPVQATDEQTVIDSTVKDVSNAESQHDAATVIEPVGSDDPTVVELPSSDEKTVLEPIANNDQTVEAPSHHDDATVIENNDNQETVLEPSPDGADPTLDLDPRSVAATIVEASGAEHADDGSTQATVLSGSNPSDGVDAGPLSVKRLDRFELIRLLGQGAFGTVHLARDPRLDRLVAIKVAKTGVLTSKSDIDRFNREARAAAALRHPNIVPVYEVGQYNNSTYLVYDFIEGRTLKAMLEERGALPPDEAATVLTKIARALDYAHSSGIIHRDIKPDNILIDTAGEPHVADFGLARNQEKDATQTREGTLMGTPAYMSPEQAAGQISKLDRRSDVWSLGVMLDEMLTARRVFSGSVVEVLTAVQTQPVKPIRSVNPDLPIDLETICLKSLERDQDQRFQTAGELADELGLWSRGEPITLRRISWRERMVRWARRNPTIAGLLATIFVTLSAGVLGSSWFSYKLVQERSARAGVQMTTVLTAESGAVRPLLDTLEDYAGDVNLLEQLQQQDDPGSLREQRRRAMLIRRLTDDPKQRSSQSKQLADWLLEVVDVEEFFVVRDELASDKAALSENLWAKLADSTQGYDKRIRAAVALAAYEPTSDKWTGMGEIVKSCLLADTLRVAQWSEALRPVRGVLKDSLRTSFEVEGDRVTAAVALATLYDEPDLVQFVTDAEPGQLGVLIRRLRSMEAPASLGARLERAYPNPLADEQRDVEDRRRANHVMALLEAGQLSLAKRELSIPQRNGVRSHVIARAGRAKLRPERLFAFLRNEHEPRLLRTAILGLAGYGESDIGTEERGSRTKELLVLYENHEDPGVHAAIEFLLRKWNRPELATANQRLQSSDWPTDGRRWHHARSGIVFAIFRDPPPFWMGTDRENAAPEENRHQRKIPRSFAISMHEVTVDQFRQFADNAEWNSNDVSSRQAANHVNWWDAAFYCNWLSSSDGTQESELCYYQSPRRKEAANAHADIVSRFAYRLPTSAEWEFAARGGVETRRHFGSGSGLLDSYAWTSSRSLTRPQEVGRLLPNQFGLFDSLGNVAEWCQTWHAEYKSSAGRQVEGKLVGNMLVDGDEAGRGDYRQRDYRGGSFSEAEAYVHEGLRFDSAGLMRNKFDHRGFRVARTLPDPD